MKLRLVGSLMKISKKLHIYCLGHYLQGSGTTLDVSHKMPWDRMTISNPHKILGPYISADVRESTKIYNKDTIYNAWGKCIIELDNEPSHLLPYGIGSSHVKAMMDVYIFYPWCGHDTHWSHDECCKKVWNSIELKWNSPIKSKKRDGNLFKLRIHSNMDGVMELKWGSRKDCYKCKEHSIPLKFLPKILPNTKVFMLTITRFNEYSFRLDISDGIFTKFGKPYHMYAIKEV